MRTARGVQVPVLRKKRQTKYLKVNIEVPEIHRLRQAADILARGGLVAFPTETVYGLGANALDKAAVNRIFLAKGRPADNPLIAHIAEVSSLATLVSRMPPEAISLIKAFWPGPLTLVLPKSSLVPGIVTAGLSSVAVRMPDHPVALALIKAARVPLAAPSANLSGRPSPTSARHVLSDLAGRIDAVVDGGPCSVGVESTVVDLTGSQPTILRPGAITRDDLAGVLGRDVVVWQEKKEEGEQAAVKSPGVKYRHYAPEAPLYLFIGPSPAVARRLCGFLRHWQAKGKKVCVLGTADNEHFYRQCLDASGRLEILGFQQQPAAVGARLFAALRAADRQGADMILAEGVAEEGIGAAVMNRLRKAAGGKIIQV